MNYNVETIAEAVHNAWWDEKKKQGITNHPCMVPYAELTDSQKEFDRATARAVLKAIDRALEPRKKSNEKLTVEQIKALPFDTAVWWAFIGEDRAFVECADVLIATIEHQGTGDRVFFLDKPTVDDLRTAALEAYHESETD